MGQAQVQPRAQGFDLAFRITGNVTHFPSALSDDWHLLAGIPEVFHPHGFILLEPQFVRHLSPDHAR